LINYYRAAVEESGLSGAPGRAIARGAKPAVLCSITTALGLLSLCTSDLTPIRKFGIYSAVGVVLTLITLFLFLPAALECWPERTNQRDRRTTSPSAPDRRWQRWLQTFSQSRLGWWQFFGSAIIRHHRWVTVVCTTVIVMVGLGITRAESTIDLMKLFDSQARILQDYRWLEGSVGRLVPMEIVVRFDDSTLRKPGADENDRKGLTLLDRMQVVSRVQRAIDAQFGQNGQGVVGPPMSAITFVPPLPKPRRGLSGVLHRTATNSQFEQAYDSLVQSGYLRVDPADGKELWRISVRVAAFENIDYGQFSRELQQVVQPEIAEANERATRAMRSSDAHADVVDAVYTGVIPIVYKAQRALLESLIESTMWSFLTIAPLLMVIARGIRAGFVTMLPNVLPVLVIFGGMGWLGIPIDIGSMMSASIALGVAVDDTIHYLTWFRHDLDESGCRHSAILSAYSHCATPTLQAALINGLGLAVFAFSTFTPTKQFGFLMLTILIAGVVAELVLLPALLAGPLGRVFQPTRSLDTIAAPKLARNTGSAGPLKSLPRQVLRNHSILRR
jgi:predicted RND superfamily exporter protein